MCCNTFGMRQIGGNAYASMFSQQLTMRLSLESTDWETMCKTLVFSCSLLTRTDLSEVFPKSETICALLHCSETILFVGFSHDSDCLPKHSEYLLHERTSEECCWPLRDAICPMSDSITWVTGFPPPCSNTVPLMCCLSESTLCDLSDVEESV